MENRFKEYKDKLIGNGPLSKKPERGLSLVINDRAVTTPKIDDKAVTSEKLADDIIDGIIERITERGIAGVTLKDELGDSTDFGVTQRAITEAVDGLDEKIDGIGNASLYNFSFVVSPEYLSTYGGGSVTATCTYEYGNFDSIKVYMGENLLGEGEDTSSLTATASITDTAVIRAEAVIDGVTVRKEHTVKYYSPSFVGSDSASIDIIGFSNAVGYTGSLHATRAVDVADGDRIIAVTPRNSEIQIEKIYMSGIPIPMNIMDTQSYIVMESVNTYKAGNYTVEVLFKQVSNS
mgnify:CR=1 FL=1